ncbi:MAG: DNA repair protein RadA/Sm, partial [Acidimicrobiaceae bacterium]
MAKLRIVYRCSDWGAAFPKWAGQCGICSAWNTMTEDVEGPDATMPVTSMLTPGAVAQPIADVTSAFGGTRRTGIDELDRVLGDGLVPGSVTLLGGEPG